MAFNNYNASNGNFTVTRQLGIRDYTIFNNTMCPLVCVLTHPVSTGNSAEFRLEPGAGRTYHSNAATVAGTDATLVCTPAHTDINATTEFPFADEYDANAATDSGARVIWSDFAG